MRRPTKGRRAQPADTSTVFAPALPRLRTELDLDGNAGRADRDGGIPHHPAPSLAAAADHSRHCDHSRRDRCGVVRRQRDRQLLILSQVILSLQLSSAVFSLVRFTSDRLKMGALVNPLWPSILAYFIATGIAPLKDWLLFQTLSEWTS